MQNNLLSQGIVNPLLNQDLQNISGIAYFQLLLPKLVGIGFLVGVLIFFFMLLSGGISWIASGGDKANVESARGKITNAIIGLVILFSLFAIIKLLEAFFNIDILKLNLGTLQIK